MSALSEARETSATMRRVGTTPSTPHIHVGQNGVRCEFCGKPLWVERHDPINVRAGRIVNRALDRTKED